MALRRRVIGLPNASTPQGVMGDATSGRATTFASSTAPPHAVVSSTARRQSRFAIIILLIAVVIIIILGRDYKIFFNKSTQNKRQSQRIFGINDAVALLTQHGRDIYEANCWAQHGLFLQSQLQEYEKELLPLTRNSKTARQAVQGFLLAASQALSNHSLVTWQSLAWIPPTDAIVAGPYSCSMFNNAKFKSDRNALANSFLYKAIEDENVSDEMVEWFLRVQDEYPNRRENTIVNVADSIAYRRYNGVQMAASKGMIKTVQALRDMGANPFFDISLKHDLVDPSSPYSNVSISRGSTSWLAWAAELVPPPRWFLQLWHRMHAFDQPCRQGVVQDKLCADAVALGLQLVQASELVPTNHLVDPEAMDTAWYDVWTETLGRFFSCWPHDMEWLKVDIRGHQQLREWIFMSVTSSPQLLSPVQAALLGGCGNSLQLLKDLHQDEQHVLINDSLGERPTWETFLVEASACRHFENHTESLPASWEYQVNTCYNPTAFGMDSTLTKPNLQYGNVRRPGEPVPENGGFFAICDSKRGFKALDLLLLRDWREAPRVGGGHQYPEQRIATAQLDHAVTHVLRAIAQQHANQTSWAAFTTDWLQRPSDLLSSCACHLQLPNATLFLLARSLTASKRALRDHPVDGEKDHSLFGQLTASWAERVYSNLSTPEYSILPSDFTPSLALQCLVQFHPPSATRQAAMNILQSRFGAEFLRQDLIPKHQIESIQFDPAERPKTIFDLLRTNISAVYEELQNVNYLRGNADPMLENHWIRENSDLSFSPRSLLPFLSSEKYNNKHSGDWDEPGQPGSKANVFHALFLGKCAQASHWCQWDHSSKLSQRSGDTSQIRENCGEKAQAIFRSLRPDKNPQLLNVSVRLDLSPTDKIGKDKKLLKNVVKTFPRGSFRPHAEGKSQCGFLVEKIPPNGHGPSDIVAEAMMVHVHWKLREISAYFVETPLRAPAESSPYRRAKIGRQGYEANAKTPLAYAFSQYVNTGSSEDGYVACGELEAMIREMVRLDATVCEGAGSSFAWEIFKECTVRTRNPQLVVELLTMNPRVFHCDYASMDGRPPRPVRPAEIFSEVLQALRQGGGSSSVPLVSFVLEKYNSDLNSTHLESFQGFVAKLVSAVLPKSVTYGRVPDYGDNFDEDTLLQVFKIVDAEALRSILENECYKRKSSVLARVIWLGFQCSSVNEMVLSLLNNTNIFAEPIVECQDSLAPFWQAIQWDMKNTEVDMQRPLQIHLEHGRYYSMRCFTGQEGLAASNLLRQALHATDGGVLIPKREIARWAAARGFTEVFDELNGEEFWTKEVVREAVRERNMNVINIIPEDARSWLFDPSVVFTVNQFPPFRMNMINRVVKPFSIERAESLWLRTHELLDAVAPFARSNEDLLPWLEAVAFDRDFFPFVEITNPTVSYQAIRTTSMLEAASSLARHAQNQTKENLSSLLVLASTNWFKRSEAVYGGEFPEMFAMAQALIDLGADPNATLNGLTSVGVSLMSEAVATRLWDAGARPVNASEAFLCFASFHEKRGLVERAVLDGDCFGSSAGMLGLAPLHCAACSCNSRILEIILSHDHDWKTRLEWGVNISEEECPSGGCRPIEFYQSKTLCEKVFGNDVWQKGQCSNEFASRLDPSSVLPPDKVETELSLDVAEAVSA